MNKNLEISIEEKINNIHGGDPKQLEVILSNEKRMIVEAPAGYGKTATMVSRIAFLYSQGRIPNPKKVLALTFSVNAALKIKRNIAEKLPELIDEGNNPINVGERVTVSNYHGFCKGVLKKFGKLLTPILKKDINLFYAIGESDIKKYSDLKMLPYDKLNYLLRIDNNIKCADFPKYVEIEKYNQIIVEYLLPKDIITHNAVILLTLELFYKKQNVRLFYQSFFPFIVVDEFQDTNCIAWILLKGLISDSTQLLLLGDPLQRIYGFIGAVPNIMNVARTSLSAVKIELDRNYRFKDNLDMLKLDKNIRANAFEFFNPVNVTSAKLKILFANDQETEATKVINKIKKLRLDNREGKIAILFRGRGENSAVFEHQMKRNRIPFFYGMFTDEDKEYIDFHIFCQSMFIKMFGKINSIGRKALNIFSKNVQSQYQGNDLKMTESLFALLEAFVKKVSCDYADISAEDKYSLLLDAFENRQLKQAMEYVDTGIILSTIHGAKGLEWPYVFVADFERWGLPGYFTCKDCVNKFITPVKCACPLPEYAEMDMNSMLDELSVFYVAVTRAKKQVYVSASAKRGNGNPGCLSCFSHIPGINVQNDEEEDCVLSSSFLDFRDI